MITETPVIESPAAESDEPYQPHITAEDRARHERRVTARRVSNLNPTPGPLRLAFAPVPFVVSGVALAPVTVGHFILLQWIESPLLALINGEPAEATEEHVVEALFLLSQNARAGGALLARGREFFNDAALTALSDMLKMGAAPAARDELVNVLNAGFATFVKHGAAKSDDEVGLVHSMGFDGGEEDGLGWMLGLVASLAREYGWGLDFIRYDLPLAQGIAFDMWARENSPWGGMVREGEGYIAQELTARLENGQGK